MSREQSGVKTLKFSCFWKASEDHFLVGRTRSVPSKSQIEKKRELHECWSVWLEGFLQTLSFVQTWLMWPQLSVICLHVKLIE